MDINDGIPIKMIQRFGRITKDNNPIHESPDNNPENGFGIVQGMLPYFYYVLASRGLALAKKELPAQKIIIPAFLSAEFIGFLKADEPFSIEQSWPDICMDKESYEFSLWKNGKKSPFFRDDNDEMVLKGHALDYIPNNSLQNRGGYDNSFEPVKEFLIDKNDFDKRALEFAKLFDKENNDLIKLLFAVSCSSQIFLALKDSIETRLGNNNNRNYSNNNSNRKDDTVYVYDKFEIYINKNFRNFGHYFSSNNTIEGLKYILRVKPDNEQTGAIQINNNGNNKKSVLFLDCYFDNSEQTHIFTGCYEIKVIPERIIKKISNRSYQCSI